jgi:hypothetical protein
MVTEKINLCFVTGFGKDISSFDPNSNINVFSVAARLRM